MGERALGAAQIGHAHGRKHLAAEFVGRKGDRNAQDRTFDTRLGTGFPEGFAALEKLELVTAPGQGDGANFDNCVQDKFVFMAAPGRDKWHWKSLLSNSCFPLINGTSRADGALFRDRPILYTIIQIIRLKHFP